MIYLLHPLVIEGWWPLVAPLLSKAWGTTNIGQTFSLSDIRDKLSLGGHHCFITEDLKYSGVFYLFESPQARVLRFYLSGGELPDCGWAEVDEFLVDTAKAFGCRYIQGEGRVGWKRLSEPFGYQVDSLIMTKEVTE